MKAHAVAYVAALLLVAPATAGTLDCAGPFDVSATHESLIETFGRENVTNEMLPFGEAGDEMATVVYPNDKSRRIEVFWYPPSRQMRRPRMLQTRGPAWVATNGIRIGMSLEQVETVNGKPFKIWGFGIEGGGYLMDNNGGRLGARSRPCGLNIGFALSDRLPEASVRPVSGERELWSRNRSLRSLKPTVGELRLSYDSPPGSLR